MPYWTAIKMNWALNKVYSKGQNPTCVISLSISQKTWHECISADRNILYLPFTVMVCAEKTKQLVSSPAQTLKNVFLEIKELCVLFHTDRAVCLCTRPCSVSFYCAVKPIRSMRNGIIAVERKWASWKNTKVAGSNWSHRAAGSW